MKEFPPFRLDVVNQYLWRSRNGGEEQRILLTPKGLRCSSIWWSMQGG